MKFAASPAHRQARPAQGGLLLAALLFVAPAFAADPLFDIIDITDNNGVSGLMDRILTVQPIMLCSDEGIFCSRPKLDTDFLAKTFAQAGVATVVLPARTLNNDELRRHAKDLNDFNKPNLGQSSNAQTINAWFLRTIETEKQDETLFGQAWKPGNGVIINTSAVNGGHLLPNGTITPVRRDTLAHEIGHNLGLGHYLLPNNLMAIGDKREIPSFQLDATQIDTLRRSPLLQASPQVDFRWSRLEGDLADGGGPTRLTISFVEGVQGMGLQRIGIDLPDYDGVQAGIRQTPYSFSTVLGNVVSHRDASSLTIEYGENMVTYMPSREGEPTYSSTHGAPELMIRFVDALRPGDSISFDFGVLGNLRNEYEFHEGRDLSGAFIDLEYDFGLSTRGQVAADSTSFDARRMAALLPSVDNPVPFGLQLAPGELPPIGELADGFETLSAVPEPRTWAMLLAGLGVMVSMARVRARRQRN